MPDRQPANPREPSHESAGSKFVGINIVCGRNGATIFCSEGSVTAAGVSWNGSVAAGGTVGVGFTGTFGSANPIPTAFSLNGVACTGGTTTTPRPAAPRRSPTSTKWMLRDFWRHLKSRYGR